MGYELRVETSDSFAEEITDFVVKNNHRFETTSSDFQS
jgi:hypothetical protein